MSAFFNVPTIAEQLAVKPDTIRGWIAAGELVASNVARKRGTRPLWRIAQEDLERFLDARRATPAPKRVRTRKAKMQGVTEYF